MTTLQNPSKKKITLLIPAYNEAGSIRPLYNKLVGLAAGEIVPQNEESSVVLTDYDWEFLFVNDGSKDNTLEILRDLRKSDPRVNIVNLSRNFGKESAMLAGMDYCSGDAVVIMDADLQDPVSLIPELVFWWQQGYEDVYGKRRSRGKESWMRKRLSLAFYSLLQGTTNIEILPNVGDFRLLDRRVVNAIISLRETQRYTKGLFCWVGYNKKEVMFDREDRLYDQSDYSLWSLFNLAIDGITSFTTSPLRISAILGFVVSIVAFIYILYIVVKAIVWGDPAAGFPTLISFVALFGGLQLFSIGIIGEYIGRIFNETKRRPPYIVESYNEQKK